MKSGFVALVGRPNVGKSTLLNRLVGQKVAIISPKPQTTRRRILGVAEGPGYQMVLIDTPGFYPASHLLGEKMLKTAQQQAQEADTVVLLLDAWEPETDADLQAARFLEKVSRQEGIPVILVVNKIDLIPRENREMQEEHLRDVYSKLRVTPSTDTTFPAALHCISAATGEGVPGLLEDLVGRLTEGAQFFPSGQVTDQPLKLQMEELVREKVLEATRQEVPHSTHVELEDIEDRKEGELLYLRGFIYVEKESQKGIVVGKGASRLKWIGTQARQEIERLSGKKVFLDLRVKVKDDWRRREDLLRSWGYE